MLVDEVSQCPTIHKLNKHEEAVAVVVGEVVLSQIVRTTQIHYCYLCPDLFQSALIFKFDYTAGIVLPSLHFLVCFSLFAFPCLL